MAMKYQRDWGGELSCKHRTGGYGCKDWCNKRLNFCCHSEECREPIPVADPLDDIVKSTLELLKASKDGWEVMRNLGLHLEGYHEEMNRLDAAIAEGERLLEGA
jgi:hypothetical protein